nr:DUF6308 family protein [Rhodococcus sp. JVH1]
MLPGIGRTKATKLIARKRPRLNPISVSRCSSPPPDSSRWSSSRTACDSR